MTSEKVFYTEEALNTFALIYQDLEREIPLCMHGRLRGDTYIIERVSVPYVTISDEEHSEFDLEDCHTEDYLGIAHNHYKGECKPSEKDLERFKADTLAILETIICSGIKLSNDNVDLFTLHRRYLK